MKIINCHKPDFRIGINYMGKKSQTGSSIDFMEECCMFRDLDNKISNEIFMKNVLGISPKK
ncbi:MAG: hypothetical protein K6E29_02685 [Cyanobacteria bacterium RUI128]|nr:hypothetical protein [Cyanobacteria bacterium RUI128]